MICQCNKEKEIDEIKDTLKRQSEILSNVELSVARMNDSVTRLDESWFGTQGHEGYKTKMDRRDGAIGFITWLFPGGLVLTMILTLFLHYYA